MVKASTTSITPATHAVNHASGGSDPILTDTLNSQLPSDHASEHAAAGADPILTDTLNSQLPSDHANEHRHGGADTLTGDVRVDRQTPLLHSDSHAAGGSDIVSDYTLSDAEIYADNVAIDADLDAWVKTHEATLSDASPDTIRISYRHHSRCNNRLSNVYRNGVAVGTQRTQGNGITTTYKEDITGWSGGDLVQIYCKGYTGAQYSTIEFFKLLGVNVEFKSLGTV